MMIGTLEVKIMIYDSNSLKDKRRVIKSLKERLRNKFNISIAEVDLQDMWNTGVLGIACVSNSGNYINKVMSEILNYMENDGRLSIVDENMNIF